MKKYKIIFSKDFEEIGIFSVFTTILYVVLQSLVWLVFRENNYFTYLLLTLILTVFWDIFNILSIMKYFFDNITIKEIETKIVKEYYTKTNDNDNAILKAEIPYYDSVKEGIEKCIMKMVI